MSVREELRDPWGWLVAGVSAGVGWAVLAGVATGPVAIAVGTGIGAVVLGTKVALGAARGGSGDAGADDAAWERPRDRLPDAPRGSIQAGLQERSRAAVDRMTDLAERPADPWLAGEVQSVLAESRPLVLSVREMAGRVTILDNSIVAARPEALAREIAELQARMGRTSDAEVLAEQQRTLAALDGQADSVDRLLRRRETLLAQMQAATVGLEGLAARTGELVALGPASQDTAEASRIVGELTTSLDAVRAGVDEARAILRDL
jgi:hypothetical protein